MADTDRFADRVEAGERLAAALMTRDIDGDGDADGDADGDVDADADTDTDADLVIALPRGGVPLGRIVADALCVPLDIAVAKKISAPNNPEYAVGAVATDGSVWWNEPAIEQTGIETAALERERERVHSASREKAARYRADGTEPPVQDTHVVVVDDGAATGATMHACLSLLRAAGARRLTVAIPVAPAATVTALKREADAVVCLHTPANFRGVGQWYREFEQVEDEEAMRLLEGGS